MTGDITSQNSLAAKIQALYDDRTVTTDKRVTDGTVADGIAAMIASVPQFAEASPVSKAYLHELRTGRKGNPSVTVIALLARYFGVPVGYFFPDDVSDDPALGLLAVKARGLSPAGMQAVIDMINHVRNLERGSQHKPPGG